MIGILTALFAFLYIINTSPDSERPSPLITYIGVFISAAYIFLGSKMLFGDGNLFDFRRLLNTCKIRRLVLALLIIAAVSLAVYFFYRGNVLPYRPINIISAENKNYFYNPSATLTFGRFIQTLFLYSIKQPFIFGLSHVLFFGPIVLFGFKQWKRVSAFINEYGAGLTLFAAASLFLGLNPQSRSVINCYPIVLPFIIKAVETMNLRTYKYYLIGAMTFLYSKLWLKFGERPLADEKFERAFYSSIGHLMPHDLYIIQGILTLITGAIFYLLLFLSF